MLNFIKPDSSITDTNKLWFDKNNYLLIGVGADQRDFDINFKGVNANLIGFLQFSHIYEEEGYTVQNWNFAPTINQNNASVFLNSKYGSFGFSKAIKPVNRENYTKTTFFTFALTVKNFTFSFEYLNFLGLDRTEPVYKTTTFLKDMRYNSISFVGEYRVKHMGLTLKNNLFYIPKKSMSSAAIVVGYMKLAIDNPTDFIPALMFKNNHRDDSIIQINGIFMDKFTSSGFFLGGPKYDMVIPIVIGKNILKPSVFYLKLSGYYGLNFQKFESHTITDTIVEIMASTNKMKGFATTTNYYIKGALIYDFNKYVFGVSAVFFKQNYGAKTMSERRLNFNAFLSFRLGAKKIYGKIDSVKKRILH